MRIDWDTPVDVLMHGGDIRYIDLNEDEIMHWKYIKRKKLPNGKWRYYYESGEALDQHSLEPVRSDATRKGQAMLNALDRYNKAEKAVNSARITMEDVKWKYEHATKYGTVYSSEYLEKKSKAVRKAEADYEKALANSKAKKEQFKKAAASYSKAAEKAKAAETKYRLKKIASFPTRAVSRGAVAILNLFSGSSRKKKKK